MAEREPRLTALVHRTRAGLEALPQTLREASRNLREDPGAVWHSPIVRIGVWCLVALLGIAGIQWFLAAVTPGGVGQLGEQPTSTATLYVACANPGCGASFSTRLPMTHRDWPIVCDRCGQKNAFRATRCPDCGGWAANVPGESLRCPRCAQRAAATQPTPTTRRSTGDPDDADDGW